MPPDLGVREPTETSGSTGPNGKAGQAAACRPPGGGSCSPSLAPDAASGPNVRDMAMFETTGEREQAWKVGALAKATGLTVRALHPYDSIGLLTPSLPPPPGPPVYTAAHLWRLYPI